MNITSPAGNSYTVGELIGKTDIFSLYQCTLPDGRVAVLKIASSVTHNGLLDREGYILRLMREEADKIEADDAKARPDRTRGLGYEHFFPVLVESFISSEEQGKRRINILGLFEISDELGELVPIGHIVSRDHMYVDLKTSVWIIGRLLKFLEFAHMLGIAVVITADNVLINRDRHNVCVFDWTEATVENGPIEPEIASEQIARAAQETVAVLGGNLETGRTLTDSELEGKPYLDILLSLARGCENNAGEAHQKLYQVVRPIWPSKFHPFTAHPVK